MGEKTGILTLWVPRPLRVRILQPILPPPLDASLSAVFLPALFCVPEPCMKPSAAPVWPAITGGRQAPVSARYGVQTWVAGAIPHRFTHSAPVAAFVKTWRGAARPNAGEFAPLQTHEVHTLNECGAASRRVSELKKTCRGIPLPLTTSDYFCFRYKFP